ncbi:MULTISPECIES: aspartate aminotransferase family protein [Vibrio]|jgi:acetylornithine/N-succinyldiaminopimelate aminotransferase|uniref:Acetylornithine aminotransferase n=1 Tax=Vibrio natriegens NBRC 15636 = ATCC 14048 = DSM 759 TaxID=1219067 RepID=A0AAN1CWW4_VIBNA|nr:MULTISPECIES: aspartate aminotransferase family protein [Vibrio]MEE3880832.1 aspartate aminotransferase family protein [Vibrio sp. YYF0003]CAH0526109.1 Succinylornithine transaminase/acetylornithine aminotransferase [Catenococcus thiocycli]AEX23331.1 bifunctional N-succinyldiaminopimelate-aminotransferase/acetylornithine transaminase protein [Vibrio sp. EJY3]ALR17102.1 acetylornithine aminotransferase [Vibrio natriegens NBRC 15636 = ATCC 14048 = DSM 759]ANQ13701.1 acetylornithine aminotrans
MTTEIKVERGLFDEVMVPCYNPMEMIPVKGEGSRIWDQEGNEYIDFAGGIAVSCLGHCHPAMVEALTEQGKKLWHLSNVMTNEPALRLAKTLTELSFAERVFFANSGAEANEAALKLARRYAADVHGPEKSEIIAFKQGFHGRTFFTVTVGGQEAYSDGFGPKPGDVTHLPYNDIEALQAHISDRTCAVMMEPLQGEGGIVPPTPEFAQAVRELCDKHNALLIFDEVQTGNGRTGHFYAYQGLGITPDILSTAKSLGGGFPIGAMLTTAKLAEHLKVGTHGSTYGGNPLACAVAEAVVNEVTKPETLAGVLEREAMFREGLEAINAKYNIFSEVRGKGLLLGAALNEEWKGRARDVLVAAGKEGLLVLIAGANVVRFTPSLVITQEEIEEGLAKLDKAIATLV